jgi:hypothetical protein
MSTGTTTAGTQNLGESAQQKAHDVLSQAQEKAQDVTGQAKGKLREGLDQRTSQAATQIGEQASDLRTVGQSLREQGKENPARAADTLAQYAEKVGGYLQNKNADGLLTDVEAFGRRQPWAVGLGGLALGFAASRFLKASSRQRYASGLGNSPAPIRPTAPQNGDIPPVPSGLPTEVAHPGPLGPGGLAPAPPSNPFPTGA